MKQPTLISYLKLSIYVFACITVFYLSAYENTNRRLIMAKSEAIEFSGNFDSKSNQTSHLIYWTNESVFDDIACRSDRRITSCRHSKLRVLGVRYLNGTANIHVGIYVYDGYNRGKKSGGDVLLIWAEYELHHGKVPGYVIDFMNGSYQGRVQMLGHGRAKIFVKLASAKENLCLRLKAMKKYGNSVFSLKTPYGIHYRFVNDSVEEFTRCVPHSFVYGHELVCNFTALNHGYSWFCGRPFSKELDCYSYDKFQMKPYNVTQIVPDRPGLEIIHIPGHCEFSQSIDIDMNKTEVVKKEKRIPLIKCSDRPKRESWIEPWPSGYSLYGKWKFNHCRNTVKFNKKAFTRCLKGKQIYFIGDSTVRQYLEVLAKIMKLKTESYDFNKIADSETHNIHISWRKHEMPFHNINLFEQGEVQSSAFQIDNLANDSSVNASSLIVIVHYSSHLQAFPPSIFRSRIKLLVMALKRLLDRKPETTVLVKGSSPVIQDTHWFDVRISMMFNEILFQEFIDLQDKVVYLDVFSIFVANNNNALHPYGQTMKQQVQQLMAYIC